MLLCLLPRTHHSQPCTGLLCLALAATMVATATISTAAHAQTSPTAADLARDAQQQRQANQRLEQLEQLNNSQRDTLQPDVSAATAAPLAPEKPCFTIHELRLLYSSSSPAAKAESKFDWLLDWMTSSSGSTPTSPNNSPIGKCLGINGIQHLTQLAQAEVNRRGFITSRVLTQPQDISSGTLTFTILPGTLHRIQADPALPASAQATAAPMREGDILNLRDIEQTLDNLQRAPTAQADFKISPASTPDQSDLSISYQRAFPLRASFSADDSGAKSTGRYQGSATLSWDNPLDLNDLFYISQGSDLQGGDPGPRGNQSHTWHYSLPWGYWTVGLTHSDSSYYQTIAGSTTGYVYSGGSSSTDLKTSYLFYRDASSKDSVYLKALNRTAQNFINGVEITVQRRASTLWELGLDHKTYIGQGVLQANLAYKKGTTDFDALPAPEEASNDGTAKPSFYSAELNWNTPWTPWKLPLAYQTTFKLQATDVALASPDRFSLGGRYTIRGTDGESSLTGDAGWLWRQELQWSWNSTGLQFYTAVDAGEVDGPHASGLSDRFIAGTALGLRWQTKRLQWDCFVGHALHTPETVRTSETSAGFSLNYSL